MATWLAFLRRHGWLEKQVNPRARVTLATFRRYVEELQGDYASLSVWNFVDDLDAMLPDEDWSLIRRVAGRLKGRSQRARPIEVGLPHAQDLYLSGLEAMREAETDGDLLPFAQAIAYRDGLAVALLAACPLRRRTFTNLILDQHLVAYAWPWTIRTTPASSAPCWGTGEMASASSTTTWQPPWRRTGCTSMACRHCTRSCRPIGRYSDKRTPMAYALFAKAGRRHPWHGLWHRPM